MFARLLKHQLKSTYKEFVILYSILIASGFLVGLFFETDSIMITISIISFVFSLLGVLIFFLAEFFKICGTSLYGKRGYLTFSIPVSSHQLVISKIMSIAIYALGLVLSLIVSFALVFIFISPNIAKEIFSVIGSFFTMLGTYNPFVGILLIINYIFSFLYSVLLIMFCFTFANCFSTKKRREVIAVLLFLLIGSIFSILANIPNLNVYLVADANNSISLQNISNILFDIDYAPLLNFTNFVLNVILTFAFYFGTTYLMSHKLELE